MDSHARQVEVSLDRGSGIPLHRQLRRHFTSLITSNQLGEGQFLPSTRALAESLGMNRLTALRAFQAMQKAGIVRVQPGRGYYVARRGDSPPPADMPRDLFGTPAAYQARHEHAFSETVRSAREMPLSFAVGYPDASMLPLKPIRRLFGRWSHAFGAGDLLYQSPGGHPLLREQLWKYLAARGIERTAERELLVTNGAQHGLDIFVRTFAKRSGFVAMEAPAYYGALAVVRVNGYIPLPILQDEHGLSVSSLAALCRSRRFDFLYTNPTHNNPTGMTMSRARRDAVVALAREHQFVILEDDTYADLGFACARPASLMSRDKDNRTCHIGSFSKSFMPGLRMGYIVGPKALIARMTDIHGVNDMCSSTLSQLVLYDALASGFYERHARRMRAIYARRCHAMKETLEAQLPPGCHFAVPKGGFFFWIRLPEHIECRELQRRCNAVGVDVALGPDFFAEGFGGNYIRLNFTLLDEDAIRLGITLLASHIRAMLGIGEAALAPASQPPAPYDAQSRPNR
jgi:DNA-binding transcriptional MocR family regulator